MAILRKKKKKDAFFGVDTGDGIAHNQFQSMKFAVSKLTIIAEVILPPLRTTRPFIAQLY
jgi:hypothetical protein